VPNGTHQFPFSSDPTRVYGGDSPRHAPDNPPIAYHLSTPVAYVASTEGVFKDPFFTGFNNNTSLVNDTRFYNYSGDYYYGRIYDQAQDGDVDAFEIKSRQLAEENRWHLRGRGPDGDYEKRSTGWADYLEFHGAADTGTTQNGGLDALYDPSNGTTSSGDIVLLGTLGRVN
jgi:hypothetical protein